MNHLISLKLTNVLNFIHANLPQIKPFIEDSLEPFDLENAIDTGVCSKPCLLEEQWFTKTGYRQFAMADLPEGFVCLGLFNRKGVETLFIMWYRDERKFWFSDLIDDSPALNERTVNRLNLAFERWQESSYDVLYDCISDGFKLLGFYVPGSDE